MESGSSPARKVMVVADPTRESAGALQYALSHVVLEKDELILFHVQNPNSWRNTFPFLKRSSSSSNSPNSSEGGEVDFLEEMAQICALAQPKISIRTETVHVDAKGREDKGNAILDRSETLGVDVVIIGQKRFLCSALLGYTRSSAGLKAFETAEYLIEKSKCTCVGVQKKGQNGGYVLNSKTHKNFWLLA